MHSTELKPQTSELRLPYVEFVPPQNLDGLDRGTLYIGIVKSTKHCIKSDTLTNNVLNPGLQKGGMIVELSIRKNPAP